MLASIFHFVMGPGLNFWALLLAISVTAGCADIQKPAVSAERTVNANGKTEMIRDSRDIPVLSRTTGNSLEVPENVRGVHTEYSNTKFVSVQSIGGKVNGAVRIAAEYPGEDCGAKINEADLDLGPTSGEIWITQDCGTAWTSIIVISPQHIVRFIDPVTYTTSESITISNSGAGIIGNGARIHFIGTGHILYLHSNAAQVVGTRIDGLILQGNAQADYGIYSDSLFTRGEISVLNIQDVSVGCAFLAGMQLMNKIEITCSDQKSALMGVKQVTSPQMGLVVGDVGLPFANNRVVNVTLEGMDGGIGLWLKNATNGNIFVGTAENIIGTCIQTEPISWGNTFVGVDTEHCSATDAIEQGTDNLYINQVSTGNFLLRSAKRPKLIGGLYNSISIDERTSKAQIEGIGFNHSGTGALADNGSDSTVDAYDENTGKPYQTGKAEAMDHSATFAVMESPTSCDCASFSTNRCIPYRSRLDRLMYPSAPMP